MDYSSAHVRGSARRSPDQGRRAVRAAAGDPCGGNGGHHSPARPDRGAIAKLQTPFLTAAQIEASAAYMGLDTQLIADGTYLVAERAGRIVGCGGWSRRMTLYGGDDSRVAREPVLLDPATDPARIRAMYTHPDAARQGVGRLILFACEQAAVAAGFRSVELMSTLSGEPLYRRAGYESLERLEVGAGRGAVPMIRMRKVVEPKPAACRKSRQPPLEET